MFVVVVLFEYRRLDVRILKPILQDRAVHFDMELKTVETVFIPEGLIGHDLA